jgi:hypothetical protein
MENVDICYDHKVYIFFYVLVCLDQEKSGNPGFQRRRAKIDHAFLWMSFDPMEHLTEAIALELSTTVPGVLDPCKDCGFV